MGVLTMHAVVLDAGVALIPKRGSSSGTVSTKVSLSCKHAFLGIPCGALSSRNRFSNILQRQLPATRASPSNGPGPSAEFNLAEYYEAKINAIKHTDKLGHIVYLKLQDGKGSLLPVYIGDFECAALVKEINKKPSVRPMTHDLMKNTLELLGFRVTKVRVNALIGNTYHARIHYSKGRDRKAEDYQEIDVDARPSDAINLAIRFGAPVYVNKIVAAKMAQPPEHFEQREESHAEISRSCKEEMVRYQDPTVLYKLQLQVAAAEERFDDAAKLRDRIDKMLASDRALSLVVAMETALEDGRYEEAARLRDEFRLLREERAKLEQEL